MRLSYTTFRDEDPHTRMQIPAPHTIEGYAPGISTAGPSSGVNQYGGIRAAAEAVFVGGYAFTAASTTTATTACKC
jgi:hypothetical protein